MEIIDMGSQPEGTLPNNEDEEKLSIGISPIQLLSLEIKNERTGESKISVVAWCPTTDKMYQLVADLEPLALPEEQSKPIIDCVKDNIQRQMVRSELMSRQRQGMPPFNHGGGIVMP